MAVTLLTTSWLGYEAATGALVFWDGNRYRPLEEAAGYATVGHSHAIANVSGLQTALDAKLDTAGGTVTGSLEIGNELSVSGTATFSSGVTAASFATAGTVTAAVGDVSGNLSVGGTFTVLGPADITGAGSNGRLRFSAGGGPLGFEFDGTTNGMSVGFRTSPENFVITSLPGFGGSDVLTVTRAGNLTMTGEITGAELTTTGTMTSADAEIGGVLITGFAGDLFADDQKLWSEANGGSGSGLDADLLDGEDGGWYTDIPARLGYTPFNAAGGTIVGNTTIAGTLSVTGVAVFDDILRIPKAEGGTHELRAAVNATTGITIRANANPAAANSIFTIQSSGPATRFGVTQGRGAFARDGFWVGIYDDGEVTQEVGIGRSGGDLLLVADGDVTVNGSPVELQGIGHYKFKGIIRLFSGSSLAIASDTRAVLVRGVGGGGGGGGAEGGASGAAAGGGGAGGAFFEAWKSDVAGETLTFSIGAGGSGGSNSGGNGGTGGTTSISNAALWTLEAEGGTGGEGQDNANWAQAKAGGFGQNATGGDLNIGGEPGSSAIRLDANNNMAGKGASSKFGAGGQAFVGNAAGQQGLGHGAGGGGGAVASNATGRAGGAGSAGYIEIWEFT